MVAYGADKRTFIAAVLAVTDQAVRSRQARHGQDHACNWYHFNAAASVDFYVGVLHNPVIRRVKTDMLGLPSLIRFVTGARR